jgi:ubiquinone/menaquinone biosynthesis C-methylase UbiE
MTPEWPVAFFDDDYLTIYRPMFSEEVTTRETEFIESALSLPAGAKMLDLACGFGRHAVGMAKRGYDMTGLDFNTHYLEIAEAVAKESGASVHWQQGDMRTLPFEAEFDAVYSYFTSFGYFSDDENENVIEGVARALKPGGKFLIDVMNRDWLLTHSTQRVWNQRENGSLLMEETSFDLKRSRVISKQIHLAPDGGPRLEKSFDLRAYTCAELTSLLHRNGLEVREAWGGIDRSEYSTESRRLVLLADRA